MAIKINIQRWYRILEIIEENISHSTHLHQNFLDHQALNLRPLLQFETQESYQNTPSKQVVINKAQLQEFGNGSIAKCFGPDFEILDNRKTPRIPNGDLLMIDRVLHISGQQGSLKPPAKITTEFDIPDHAWFMVENQYPVVPIGILMEIALQPCGILSAYLGTSLALPPDVNLFRNLDGEIIFSKFPEFWNKTITNNSSLLTSVAGGGMLIQKYSFELSIDEEVFLKGNSSFGYFTQSVMQKQSGIDSSTIDLSQLKNGQNQILINSFDKVSNNFHQHLDLIGRISFHEDSGKYGSGLIVGEKKINGNEWFFENHFYQDPVMPGSLGIEAIIQGLWMFAKNSNEKFFSHETKIDFSNKEPFIWKYRGQVIPTSKNLIFEIHLKENKVSDDSINLLADADLWVDGVKIYSVQDISMNVGKGNL